MSDVQQGPDWWLASDGKWYPQTSKADYRPPSPPQPPAPPSPPAPPPVGWQVQQPQNWPGYAAVYAKPPGVSTTFSGWLQAAFWLSAAFYAVLALTSITAISRIDSVTESASQYKSWADAHDMLYELRVAGIGLSIPVLVLLVIWCFQTHKAASSLEPGERRWSRGWAIGGWFIPVAGYVIPLLVFLETERIATAQRWDGRVNADWRRTGTVERSGWGWWCLYFLSGALIIFGLSLSNLVNEPTIEQARAGYIVALIGSTAGCLSCLAAISYFRMLTERLSPAGLANRA
jgi:hypothetical protein